jgi:hypothetical protein
MVDYEQQQQQNKLEMRDCLNKYFAQHLKCKREVEVHRPCVSARALA